MIDTRYSQRLWYSQPAGEWNEALPIGNGRLGAMFFGGTAKEKLQLNEDSVWYGGPRNRNNEDALPHLPEIRKLIMAGRLGEAEELAAMSMAGLPEAQRHYLPLGELLLSFGNHGQTAEDYTRELDLEQGVARIKYRIGEVNYTREMFASFPDQAIVIRIATDNKDGMSLKARFTRHNWRYLEKTKKWKNSGLIMSGDCGGKGGSSFAAVLKAVTEDGLCRTVGEYLLVDGASSVTMLLAAGTTFRHSDPDLYAKRRLQELSQVPYEELLARHTADYRSLYGRVKLKLPENLPQAGLPTDKRLKRFQKGRRTMV